jgi:hypothetical protein
MDLSAITDIKELKAMAYDQLVLREQADSNLRVINQRMMELENQKSTDKKTTASE